MNAPMPLVSILVPSYNKAPYLAECLDSALGQTYPNIEVIVVDDGSTDDSFALARTYEARGVRVIAQDNQGQSGAYNTAFEASSGAYIQYLDADDVLHPGKVEAQVARLRGARETDMASGPWARFRSETAEAVFTPYPVWQDLGAVEWLASCWSGGGMMPPICWLVPRKVVEAAGPWLPSRRWAANIDADFFTRTLLASTGCLFCPDAKSYYRAVPGSQSSLSSRRSLEAALAVLVDTGNALLKAEDSARTRAAYADNLQRFAYATYPDSADLVAEAERKIAALGGSKLPVEGSIGGAASTALAKVIGWKAAKRARLWLGAARRTST